MTVKEVVVGESRVVAVEMACHGGGVFVLLVVAGLVDNVSGDDFVVKFALVKVVAGPLYLCFKTGGTSLLAEILILVQRQRTCFMSCWFVVIVGAKSKLLDRRLRRGEDGGARLR